MNALQHRNAGPNLAMSRKSPIAPITIIAVCTFSALTGQTTLTSTGLRCGYASDEEAAEIRADRDLMADLAEARQNIANGELTDGPEDLA